MKHEPEDRRQEERRVEDEPEVIERKILGVWAKPLMVFLLGLIGFLAIQQFVHGPELAASAVSDKIKSIEDTDKDQWRQISQNSARLSAVEAQLTGIQVAISENNRLSHEILTNVLDRKNTRGG